MATLRLSLAEGDDSRDALLREGALAVGADSASAWSFDGHGEPPRLVVSIQDGKDGEPRATRPPDPGQLEAARLHIHESPASLVGRSSSVLDVGVWRDGRLAGCLRMERPSPWDANERAFAAFLADRLALVLESAARRTAENVLRYRERRIDDIEALTNLGSWEWDLGETITWSKEQLRIHGIDPSLRVRTFSEFLDSVHPDDRTRVLEECERLVGGTPFSFPYRIVRSDGTIREMHAMGKLVPDPSGPGVRAVGTSQDVTDRNAAERALRASEESYRTLFECSSEGIWIHDVQTGEMVDVNAAGGEMYGYTVAEMMEVGHDALNYPDPEYSADRIADYMERVLAGETPRFEWKGLRKDGAAVWAEVTLRKVVYGGAERIVASARDISERKAAERAVQEAYEALEARVADRTAELARANAALASEVEEHQRAREQLVRRTDELESVLAALPDPYFKLARDGTILDHRAGQGLAPNLPADKFLGRKVADVLPPAVTARVEAAIESIDQAGQLVCVEYDLTRDGATRSFEARLLPTGDGSLIAIVRDITDRKASDEAIRRSEEHFRALIENGSDYIMIVDTSAAITYVAPSVERLLGYTPEEMLGKRPVDLVHPEDVAHTHEVVAEIIANPGKVVRAEYRIRHKDGSWRVFENFGRTLGSGSSNASIVANGRDITERKLAHAEIARQKAYFEEILDSIDAGIAVFDAEGRYEYATPRAIRNDEVRAWVIGRSMVEYGERMSLPARTIAERQASVEKAIREGVPNQFEQQVSAPDGGYRQMLRRLIPIVDESGTVLRMVAYSLDITERKEAEMAVEAAKDEAERANRAKSEFLSRMSHELRTPLNGILGFAQVLERNGLRPEQQRFVGHILKGGQHLLRLINEVLELSRIEAGRMSLSLESIELNSALREGLDLVRPLADQARIELDMDPLLGRDAHVGADRQRLVQILLNLLSNGIKYNRAGGSVRITCEPCADPVTGFSILVSDTGRGIPEDRLDQLFVPFSRLGAEETETEGTGLGLALSRRLAEAMGAALSLEHTGPEGSTFRLDLSAAANPLSETRSSDAVSVPAGGGGVAPATILYIEDNLTNLNLVETFLEAKPSLRTISALRGRTGIELAREKRPDLILLDLHLPDLHGEDVLRELRADRVTACIPVIVVSADATSAAVQRLLAAGADAYLTKPLDLDDFLNAIERYLPAKM